MKTPPQDSAYYHVRGQSEFIDDKVPQKDELIVDFAYAPFTFCRERKDLRNPRPSGRGQANLYNDIPHRGESMGLQPMESQFSVDLRAAKKIQGVIALYTASDIPHNRWGMIGDWPLLAENEILYYGQPVVLIAATSKKAIQKAKQAISIINISVNQERAILSIDEAIEAQSFLDDTQIIGTSEDEVEKIISHCPHQMKGVFCSGGQEHFYLENQTTLTTYQDGRLTVYASTQNPTETQHTIAHALGLDYSQVNVVVARMGGGFGGKESQSVPFSFFSAFVAHRHQCSARIVLSKDDDMITTGKRHPFQTSFHVGFNHQGKILALSAKLFSNGGAYLDLSTAIMQRALLHIDNAYNLGTVRLEGRSCKTNLPPNTAFRGFGAPQGIAVIEHIIEEMALKLKLDALDIRFLNLYQSNSQTHFGQEIENFVLPDLMQKLRAFGNYDERRKQILEHNTHKNQSTIKGLCLLPVKFGISFTAKFLNQGNALVNVHLDGSVQISTGGTEMGQGLNTKIRQIAASVFEIPLTHCYVMPTSTEKNSNTSPTAASSGTDINGMATLLACQKIKERLSSIREEGMSFQELVKKAYFDRISLCDYAFYKTPHIDFDKKSGTGRPFLYFTQGAALSEVEIDRTTGTPTLTAVDILMDLGIPLNTGLDRGQITGAFVQGQGWATMENLVIDKQGRLLSHSPTTYKIPGIKDVPEHFHVEFYENSADIPNVARSKAVGEPPFVLGLSVFFAIKDALGNTGCETSNFALPATNENIFFHLDL